MFEVVRRNSTGIVGRRWFFGINGAKLVSSLPSKSFDLREVVASYNPQSPNNSVISALDEKREVFKLALPPPNVTGRLHLGHALTAVVEDAICRYERLCGNKVVWYGGFDHAGIATQAVVEKQLWIKKRIRRHLLSDEEFLAHCTEWKENRVYDMKKQFCDLGIMLDMEAAYYTMDERFSKAVRRAFVELHSSGNIFRAQRMINWCPSLQSALSDEEVNHISLEDLNEISVPHKDGMRKIKVGQMHKIAYELLSRRERVEVATTRPETLFADVALAVNPCDSRYCHLIGEMVRHPLVHSRILPILGDEAVVPDKGTGVLKITPSHDFLDFEIAQRHLEKLPDDIMNYSCIDEMGKLVNAGDFDGQDRFDVIEKLRAVNAYDGIMKHDKGSIAVCSRTGDVIEPMVKDQWFLDCSQMNRRLLEAVENQKIIVKPSFLTSKLVEWLQNNEPWCLSRQITWGHRIPAYLSGNKWFVAESAEEAEKVSGKSLMEKTLVQDNDVLDTWFSSSLVPLVLAGWPEKRVNSHCLSLMETGYDIVGFWVVRMLTVCEQLCGHYPFDKIFLHGLIRDSKGRKMSKSLGNVIEPGDVIDGRSLEEMLERVELSSLPDHEKSEAKQEVRNEFPNGIQKFGADALRFALLRHDITGLDINVDIVETASEGYRFCNKLWNLCNYSLMVFAASPGSSVPSSSSASANIADRWILSRLGSVLLDFGPQIKGFTPHHAATGLQKFIQGELCDFYLETTKKALREKDQKRLAEIADTLRLVLHNSLAALSVIMPFISNYLFEKVKVDDSFKLDCFILQKVRFSFMLLSCSLLVFFRTSHF
ncbi:unnamed protein product [Enterobius vermicularis]|uniref:valine--tRNA ligase n=1 Tax=Enterobius vermicularis TaxID=51028 RepID=A0A0N4VGG9_ENTVE|nr:unnamed protein product [Enterobius vermicularis]